MFSLRYPEGLPYRWQPVAVYLLPGGLLPKWEEISVLSGGGTGDDPKVRGPRPCEPFLPLEPLYKLLVYFHPPLSRPARHALVPRGRRIQRAAPTAADPEKKIKVALKWGFELTSASIRQLGHKKRCSLGVA